MNTYYLKRFRNKSCNRYRLITGYRLYDVQMSYYDGYESYWHSDKIFTNEKEALEYLACKRYAYMSDLLYETRVRKLNIHPKNIL